MDEKQLPQQPQLTIADLVRIKEEEERKKKEMSLRNLMEFFRPPVYAPQQTHTIGVRG